MGQPTYLHLLLKDLEYIRDPDRRRLANTAIFLIGKVYSATRSVDAVVHMQEARAALYFANKLSLAYRLDAEDHDAILLNCIQKLMDALKIQEGKLSEPMLPLSGPIEQLPIRQKVFCLAYVLALPKVTTLQNLGLGIPCSCAA